MRTVKSVEVRDMGLGGRTIPVWEVGWEDDSGPSPAIHLFPIDTLYWRAAEYGIPIEDARQLVDVILHEGHAAVEPHHPHFLYNTDRDTARRTYLERIEKIRPQHGVVDPHGLLDRIYQHHADHLDRELHRHREGVVEGVRNRAKPDPRKVTNGG